MKINSQNLISLLLGTALAGFALPARAATESFTQNFASSSAPLAINGSDFPDNFTFPQFLTSLGVLTEIQITLNTTGLLQSEIANVGSATTFTGANASGTITFSGLEGAQASVNLSANPYSGSIGAGTISSPTYLLGPQTSGSDDTTTQVSLTDFGSYESSVSGATFQFPLNASLNGSFSGNGPSSVSFAGAGSAYGSVEITYTYTAAVPEPEDMVSLGLLGFGGWTAMKRFQQARRKSSSL
jgi:hypothetical protein